jgi:hypothetical protein
MTVSRIRDELDAHLDRLDDSQLVTVLALVKAVERERSYSEDQDPMLNGQLAFSGGIDLSERIESILGNELGKHPNAEDSAE